MRFHTSRTYNRSFSFPPLLLTFLTALSTTAAEDPAGSAHGIQSIQLKNGLEIITVENHAVPLVTIELAARNGAFTEPPEFDGLSHLYEHMFFKANRAIPNQALYLERLSELGASWNGTTSAELVNYYITVPRSNLREGIEFMRDAVMFPLFKREELIAERPVVNAEFDRNEANPGFQLYREVGKRLWYKHYSRKNTIGDRDVILTATREKMRMIQRRYYIPNNMTLLVAGDIDVDLVREFAQEFFEEWKRGKNPARTHPIPKHPPLEESSTVAVIQPVGAVSLNISMHGPSMKHDTEATFAADVLSFVLSQPASKFQRALVDSGHFDGIGLGYSSLVHTGPIIISGRTSADRFDTALQALDEQLALLLEPEYYTEEEIETAKNLLEVSEIYSREETSSFVHSVAFWWSTGGLDYFLSYLDRLRAVTRKDIDRYVKRYIAEKPRVVAFLCTEENLAAIRASENAEIVRPEPYTPKVTETATEGAQDFEVDGLRVILNPNPANEIVSAGLYFRGSLAYTGTEKAGIEYFALQAATKGSENFSKDVVDRELAAMGTKIGVDVGADSASMNLRCLKRNLDRSWEIFTDSIEHPLFDEKEVELIRERHLNSIRQRKQDPDSSLVELGRPNYFRGHPYASNPEGTEESFTSLTLEDLKAFHKQAFVRARATLILSGDVSREEATALVQSGFADFPQGEYTAAELPKAGGHGKAELVTEEREIPTTYIIGYHHAPSIDDPDYPAMVIAERILRMRLFEEVRTKRSLSYAPASGISTRKTNFGYLYVSTTQPETTIDVMLGEVRRLIQEPIEDKELRDAKNSIVTRDLMSNQTNAALMARLALYEFAGGDWRNAAGYLEAIEAVRAMDIQRVAETYINTFNFALLGSVSETDGSRFDGSLGEE